MDNLISQNKLLNTRRSLLKAASISTLALVSGSVKAFSQGIDFKCLFKYRNIRASTAACI